MSQPSFRLSKAHRTDICEAVLKNWEAQNPMPQPTETSLDTFIHDCLQKYLQNHKVIDFSRLAGYAKRHMSQLTFREFTPGIRNPYLSVRVLNQNDEERQTFGLYILPETISRLGLEKATLWQHLDSPKLYFSSNTYKAPKAPWSFSTEYEKPGFTSPMSLIPTKDLEAFIDTFSEKLQEEVDTKTQEDFLSLPNRHFTVNTTSSQNLIGFLKDVTITIPHTHPYLKELQKLERLVVLWNRERKQLRDEVMDTLEQFNTSKQLIEGWPAVVGYLPPHLQDTRAINLPAVCIDRLNERLSIK